MRFLRKVLQRKLSENFEKKRTKTISKKKLSWYWKIKNAKRRN